LSYGAQLERHSAEFSRVELDQLRVRKVGLPPPISFQEIGNGTRVWIAEINFAGR
jgi:hypothetical protein